jgi:hypothetical protein
MNCRDSAFSTHQSRLQHHPPLGAVLAFLERAQNSANVLWHALSHEAESPEVNAQYRCSLFRAKVSGSNDRAITAKRDNEVTIGNLSWSHRS